MTRRIAGLFLVALMALLPRPVRADTVAPAADEVAILAVVSAFARSWNDHDMDRLSELFTSDADWVNVRGNRWAGVGQIRENHIAIHKRFYSKSKLDFSEVSVRLIAPDVAVVHAKETITASDVPAAAGLGPDSQMSLVIAPWCRMADHQRSQHQHRASAAQATLNARNGTQVRVDFV